MALGLLVYSSITMLLYGAVAVASFITDIHSRLDSVGNSNSVLKAGKKLNTVSLVLQGPEHSGMTAKAPICTPFWLVLSEITRGTCKDMGSSVPAHSSPIRSISIRCPSRIEA